MRFLALPGVFRPLSDTWMLAESIVREPGLRGGEALDLCTGSGALAVVAASHGARRVSAVDASRRAVLSACLHAALNGVSVRARRGDLFAPVARERFDVIVSNPPYVPSTSDELPRSGLRRAWDAGRDGRAVLDRICVEAPRYLRPGGALLLVHSSVCGEQATLAALAAGGLEPETLARRRGPLGPLLSARAADLERRGLLAAGQREEVLLVLRGRLGPRPTSAATSAAVRATA